MPTSDGSLVIEGARVLFRNFAGAEGMYNRAGDRNFCVVLEPDLAAQMSRDGWNIKTLKSREPGEEGTPYLEVAVGFKFRPPKMVLITTRNRTVLDEDTCEMLDMVEGTWDIIIRPYQWNVNGKSGIKAYLKTVFVEMQEDYLELKYANYGTQPALTAHENGESYMDNVVDAEWFEGSQRELEA